MACDIELDIYEKTGEKWERIDPLPREMCLPRNYAMFAWLADVRNYFMITPKSEPRGWPEWAPEFDYDDPYSMLHSPTWYLLSELLEQDYDSQITEDTSFNIYRLPGDKYRTLREFLGQSYFDTLWHISSRFEDPNKVALLIAFDG